MNPELAEEFTLEMMKEYGLTQAGWTFSWGRARRTFGSCHYRTRVIRLSKPLTEMNTEAQVLDTVMHELAHALVGPRHGHGPVWKAKAAELGATPERCGDGITVPPQWAGVCPTCELVIEYRHRRPAYYTSRHCRRCRDDLGHPPDVFHPSTELEWVASGLVPA